MYFTQNVSSHGSQRMNNPQHALIAGKLFYNEGYKMAMKQSHRKEKRTKARVKKRAPNKSGRTWSSSRRRSKGKGRSKKTRGRLKKKKCGLGGA